MKKLFSLAFLCFLCAAMQGQMGHLETLIARDSLQLERIKKEHQSLSNYRMQAQDIAIFQIIVDSLEQELENPQKVQNIVRKKRVKTFFETLHKDLNELNKMWYRTDAQFQEVDSLQQLLLRETRQNKYTLKSYRERKKVLQINAKRRVYHRFQKDLTSKEIKSMVSAMSSYDLFNEASGDQVILPEFFAYFNLAFQNLQDYQLETLQEKTAAIELELQEQTDSMTQIIRQQATDYQQQKTIFELQRQNSERLLNEKNEQSDSLKAKIQLQESVLLAKNGILEAKIADLQRAQQAFALLNTNIQEARKRNSELENAAEKLDTKVQSLNAVEVELRTQNQAILAEQATLKKAKFQTERWLQLLAALSIFGAIMLGIAAIRAYRDKQKISRAYHELEQTKDELQLKTQELDMSHRELNHRVKNNLQLISSLIYLQEDEIEDEEAREVFSALQGRIDTIKIVHQKLYAKQNQDLTVVNMAEYIEGLVNYIVGEDAHIQLHISDIFMEMDHATDIGLIINELVTNCVKYAFPFSEHPRLHIEMSAANGMLHLKVKDNGPGFPADFSIATATSFGLTSIVEMFVHKSGKGHLKTYNNKGGVVEIAMPYDAEEGTLTA